MSDLRQAAQQALEALKRAKFELRGVTATQDIDDAIAALRAALAQPDAEPVAWLKDDGEHLFIAAPHEPGSFAVYAAPPARKRLTDAEIDDLAREMVKSGKSVNWIARAIEQRVHRIRGDDA